MYRSALLPVVVLTMAIAFGPQRGAARAAEVCLRPQCTCSKPLVTLGDVAEIFAADREQAAALMAIELFPAPAAGRQRFLRLREVQDLLVLRGVNLTDHRLSGCSQVTILAAGETPKVEVEPPLSFAATRRTTQRVHDAVVEYLRARGGADLLWTVDLDLTLAQARAVGDSGRTISVSGGSAPWTGTQSFEVFVDAPGQPAPVTVEARVSVPAAVVVTLRSLGRGTVIRETDVELQYAQAREASADAFESIEQVVGKETARAIPAGKVVQHESLRQPLVVRRGDIVTVYARSAGIRVRLTARARDDASLGDLVAVESLQDRKSFHAQVTGVREVEVFARATQAETASNDGSRSRK